MTVTKNQKNIKKGKKGNDDSILDSIKILSKLTKKDIEKSYNIDTVKGTEAYFSNRYGWTLRRIQE